MKKFILIASWVLVFLFFTPVISGSILAQSDSIQYGVSYGQYAGAAAVQAILVSKFVGKPVTTQSGRIEIQFVNNLSASEYRFKPGEQVNFKIVVKNTSTVPLFNVTVRDFVPQFVESVESPGAFDPTTRTISFGAGDFAVGEEKTFFIKVQVVPQEQLPADRSLFAVVNKAQAFSANIFGEAVSQFFIEKQVLGAAVPVPQAVPAAGPSLGLLFLTVNALAIIIGVFLIKK